MALNSFLMKKKFVAWDDQSQSGLEMKWMRTTVHKANAASVTKRDTTGEHVHLGGTVSGSNVFLIQVLLFLHLFYQH